MQLPTEGHQTAKAYSYVRFSSPQQLKGDSHRRQTEKAAQYAAEKGLVLDTELTLEDLGVSAYRGRNAKAGNLGVFLKAVEAGRVRVQGSLDDVQRAHDSLRAYVHAAVRAPSQPALLSELRAGPP